MSQEAAVSAEQRRDDAERSNNEYACEPCKPGTFHDAVKGTCEPCAAGSYQDKVGQSACFECPLGSYCVEGAAAALPCPGGMYGGRRGLGASGECSASEDGTYCFAGSTSPTPCGKGTATADPTKQQCDMCVEGTYQGEEGETACIACGDGFMCPSGSQSTGRGQ